MRLLITGITGFVGSHMAEYAIARGAAVSGSVRWRSRTENIEHLRGQIQLIECDLRDSASVRRLLAASAPTHVIHLAAQSFVGASWHTPAETLSTNLTGQVNLLEGIREIPSPPRFLVIGTSEKYGLVYPDELPGPRRGDVFVTSNFAKQVAEVEAGRHDPVIHVGDLTPRRDYSDVRAVVRGYWMLLERGEPGEVYNLCSGRTWTIRQVLEFYVDRSRAKGISVQVDPERLRPSDVMVLEGDPSKIHKALGWQTEIPFERTLTDLLEYWRQRVASAPR